MDEADALPDAGVPMIAVFRPIENVFIGRQRQKLENAIRAGWVLTVCTAAAAEDIGRVAIAIGKRANVQVMVDTGMTRSGTPTGELGELLRRIDSRPAAAALRRLHAFLQFRGPRRGGHGHPTRPISPGG